MWTWLGRVGEGHTDARKKDEEVEFGIGRGEADQGGKRVGGSRGVKGKGDMLIRNGS